MKMGYCLIFLYRYFDNTFGFSSGCLFDCDFSNLFCGEEKNINKLEVKMNVRGDDEKEGKIQQNFFCFYY